MDHISKSQIEMFMRCEFQYFMRYIQGIKKRPGMTLTFGGSFDEGMNANYEFKKENEQDMDVAEVQEIFAAEFEKRTPNTEWAKGEDPNQIKDHGVLCVETFHKEICPKVKPAEVQLKREMEFENSPIKLVTILDLLETNDTISDVKTAGKSWPDNKEWMELQPPLYSLAEDGLSDFVREFRFDICVRTKRPKVQQRHVTVRKEQREGVLLLISATIAKIEGSVKSGIFLPSGRNNSYLCSRKYCGFWQECEKEYKWKIKE